jgi:hypothetical protein
MNRLRCLACLLGLGALLLGGLPAAAHEQHATVVSGGVTYYVSSSAGEPVTTGSWTTTYPSGNMYVPMSADFEYEVSLDGTVSSQQFTVNWQYSIDSLNNDSGMLGSVTSFTVTANHTSGHWYPSVSGSHFEYPSSSHTAYALIQIRKSGYFPPIEAQILDQHTFSVAMGYP